MSSPARTTPTLDIQQEAETSRGWTYRVVVTRGSGSTSHQATLSWADHDYWTGGALPPSRVLEAILSWLLEEHSDFAWPARFDAATIRRRFPDIDDSLGRRL